MEDSDVLDLTNIDMPASAFVRVKTEQAGASMDDLLSRIDGVTEAYSTVGSDYDYLVKVNGSDNEELGRVIREVGGIDGVVGLEVAVVLGTLKKSEFRNPRTLMFIADQGVKKPYERFLSQLLSRGKERNHLHAMMRLFGRPYTGAPSPLSGAKYWYYSARMWSRAELYIDRLDAKDNKAIFDQLLARKTEIENAFGDQLYWQRLDDKRACRISFRIPGGYSDHESAWPEIQDRLIDVMVRLEAAISPQLERLRLLA